MEITTGNKKRIGGSSKLQIALIDDIETFPIATNQSFDENPTITEKQIVFKEGKSWIDIPVEFGSIKPDLKSTESKAGPYYKTKITAKNSDDTPANTKELNLYRRRKIIVRTKMNTGEYWKLYGTKTNPLRFGYEPTTSQKIKETPGYNITITGSLLNDPLYIQP